MKKYFILLLLFCLCSGGALQGLAETGPEKLFQESNHAYTLGHYQEAVDGYLRIAGRDGMSAALLYNLANSYAALGRTGKAVVNYERALRLSPGDADIKANLEQVRKDTGLYRDHKPLYEELANLLGPDQWLLLAGLGLAVLALCAITRYLVPSLPAAAARTVMITALLLIITVLPPAIVGYQGWNDGVVTDDQARLLISPFAEAASTGTIKAGRVVRPRKTHGDFVLVRDETGRSGWLHRNQFEAIAGSPVQNPDREQ